MITTVSNSFVLLPIDRQTPVREEKAADAYEMIREWLKSFDGSEIANVEQAVETIEKNSNEK